MTRYRITQLTNVWRAVERPHKHQRRPRVCIGIPNAILPPPRGTRVGRHHRDSPRAAGTPGEAGRFGPSPACPSGALWRLSGAPQPPARERHPHTAPAGAGGTGSHDHIAAVELGTAAASGVCTGYGALPVVSARDPAAHRRHHARRGDPQDPPSSETLCRPTPHHTCPLPPSTVRLGGLSRRQRVGARCPCVRRDGVAHTAERVPSYLAIDLPTLLSPQAPLWRSSPPACAASPALGALERCG